MGGFLDGFCFRYTFSYDLFFSAAYYGAFNFDQDDDNDGTDSEDEQAQIDKYRELAQNIKEQEKKHETKDVEMEITWEPGK